MSSVTALSLLGNPSKFADEHTASQNTVFQMHQAAGHVSFIEHDNQGSIVLGGCDCLTHIAPGLGCQDCQLAA